MSGAAANAAARRRRGGAQENTKITTNTNTNRNRSSNNFTGTQKVRDIDPNSLLIEHDMKLHILEQKLREQINSTEKIPSLESSLDEDSDQNQLNMILNDFNRRLEGVEKISNNSSNSKSSISDKYLQKIDSIEKEVAELKKLILKVQTFTMETNLTLMKVKNVQNNFLKENKEKEVEKEDEHEDVNEDEDVKEDENIVFNKIKKLYIN